MNKRKDFSNHGIIYVLTIGREALLDVNSIDGESNDTALKL